MQKEIEKLFNINVSKEEIEAIVEENPNLATLAILAKIFNYDNIQTDI